LPIKMFIFNNKGYASIRATQHHFFNDRFIGVDKGSGVSIPDTLRVAELYGIKGLKLENSDEVETVIKATLDCEGPSICDVVCDPSQPIIPTVYSSKKSDGTLVSKPLEDMYPFLKREEFYSNMIIKPCKE